MKRNEKILSEIKLKIQQIINIIPDQFALNSVKTHLRNAIGSIETVEKKRQKREEVQKQNLVGFTSYETAKAALDILDQMLEAEKQNLKQAEKTTETTLLNG